MTAKRRGTAIRRHGATSDEICAAVLDTVDVTEGNASPCVGGKISDKDGKYFNSRDGLEFAADYVLSLSQDEE